MTDYDPRPGINGELERLRVDNERLRALTKIADGDIVKRLRHEANATEDYDLALLCDDAADEIKKLNADLWIVGERFAEVMDEIERLRGELRSRCIRCDPGEACIGICGAPAALTQNEQGGK